MKIQQKRTAQFGGLITAEHLTRGTGPADKLVHGASQACWVLFREPTHLTDFDAKERLL